MRWNGSYLYLYTTEWYEKYTLKILFRKPVLP